MREEIDKLWEIVRKQGRKIAEMNSKKNFQKFFKQKFRYEKQKDSFRGLHLALCVDTRDPMKQGRVRFFSPLFDIGPGADTDTTHKTTIEQLDWAWPITPFGGFDDSGAFWVPPPGTTLCILFQNSNPKSPFYMGTTWQRNKGPENNPNWGVDVPEYNKIFKGHRKGYMVGKNDESQSFPPNNTDNYQGYDLDSSVDQDLVPDAGTKTTWPHQYTVKTPEKHFWRMDDGDPKCNRRYKRIEIQSSTGYYFIMKDDPYHYCGEWTNPQCDISFVDVVPSICIPSFVSVTPPISGIDYISVIPQPYACQQGPENCPTISETSSATVEEEYLGTAFLCPIPSPMSTISVDSVPVDCMGVINGLKDVCFEFNNTGKNRYQKHRQECYPFLSGRCALNQAGMQLLARSGATIAFDDSVEEPRERPEWERSLQPFDYDGCTGVFKGRTFWRSATGHFILMDDEEINPKIRGPRNGITVGTASGNVLRMNDHTKAGCVAGENRGVYLGSTANHSLEMSDNGNQQCSPERDGCAKPGAFSRQAFVRLRSGYGLKLTMSDAQSQQKTDQQYIQLMAPQTDNLQRGSHVFHMQERPTGPGQIFLRAGGDYIVYSYDSMTEVVGSDDNPSNKLEFVSKMKIVNVKDVYYNKAKTHVLWADDHIFLLAGKDCSTEEDDGTCAYPVVVAKQPIPEYISYQLGIKASEHVFASAKKEPDDPCDGIASDI